MKDYSFGSFICELRRRNGLSQFQLGTLVGVSNKAVSKWENGAATPKTATCHKLAIALGVSIDELLACKYHTSASAEKGIFAMKNELWKEVQSRLYEVYGDCPPISILGRYETERQMLLSSDLIVHFGFLSKLAIAVRREGSDLFLFGSINSSFIAWLMGITPVNPLEPHYYCPLCKRVEFVKDAADGWDLPEKNCVCGGRMHRDGHSIPCESALTQLGRKARFDVNLPPSLQKTAGNMLAEYFQGAAKLVEVAFKDRLPGPPMLRYVLLPAADSEHACKSSIQMRFEDFFQQYGDSSYYTFLGSIHCDALQRLCQKTNRSPNRIDFLNSRGLQAYHFADIPAFLDHDHRSILPMLRHFAPDTFSDILQIYGFRHGSGAWEENGEGLVRDGIAQRSEIIAFSENIYGDILKRLRAANITGTGLPMQVMDDVRLGRYCQHGMPKAIESSLLQLGFPAWYVDSMKKIRYLFPKGHAVAYLSIEMRLVWFSIHHSDAFASAAKAIECEYPSY